MTTLQKKSSPLAEIDNSGKAISIIILLMFGIYLVFHYFVSVPRKNEDLKNTFISQKDYSVISSKVEGATKVQLEGLDNLTFSFSFIKPVPVGQTFAIVQSKVEGMPQVSLCESVPTEKTGVIGKSATPITVVSKNCYVVGVEGALPEFEKTSFFDIENPGAGNSANPVKRELVITWMYVFY